MCLGGGSGLVGHHYLLQICKPLLKFLKILQLFVLEFQILHTIKTQDVLFLILKL